MEDTIKKYRLKGGVEFFEDNLGVRLQFSEEYNSIFYKRSTFNEFFEPIPENEATTGDKAEIEALRELCIEKDSLINELQDRVNNLKATHSDEERRKDCMEYAIDFWNSKNSAVPNKELVLTAKEIEAYILGEKSGN